MAQVYQVMIKITDSQIGNLNKGELVTFDKEEVVQRFGRQFKVVEKLRTGDNAPKVKEIIVRSGKPKNKQTFTEEVKPTSNDTTPTKEDTSTKADTTVKKVVPKARV